MECRREKRLRRTHSAGSSGGSGLPDMNASPPREVDGDDVAISAISELKLSASDNKMQDTRGNPFIGFTLTSPNTQTNTPSSANEYSSTMQVAQKNLDIATQNANLVYFQALKNYIAEQRGVLPDGWSVKFEFSENNSKNTPIYCAPNGRRFSSMPEVANFLGLQWQLNCVDNGSRIPLMENGSRDTKSMSHCNVSNGGSAVEVNESESFLEGFPVQFQDFFVTQIGKINPQISFHNTYQIFPIGYKSLWHDKLTGSIFTCEVLESDDFGPIFKVNRIPCTKQSLPNPSTIIYQPNPSNTENTLQHKPSRSFFNRDIIGEFSVEGRSTSSAWQIALETFLCAFRHSFQDLNFVNFFCNHNENETHNLYNIESLDKFGCLTGQLNSIPDVILTTEQLEVCCLVLRKYLQVDRFGLDAEFVQELIEKLPGVNMCSEYKPLDMRGEKLITYTVKSGFFKVLCEDNSQVVVMEDSVVEIRKRSDPPGVIIVSNLPSSLFGDVFQVHEFYLQFHKLLGQEAPLSIQNLENELLNPFFNNSSSHNNNPTNPTNESNGHDSSIKSTSIILSNFQTTMLKSIIKDTLSKVVIRDPIVATELKSRKGKKKIVNENSFNKSIKIGIFPLNEITWPELARRYISVFLSAEINFENLEITSREFSEMFRCLNGDGGPISGSLTGMAALKADAMILAEASEKIFSSTKPKINDFVINIQDLHIIDSTKESKKINNQAPEWIQILEPIRTLATNVGARIRDPIRIALQKNPPDWAKKVLEDSISKNIYKGNAAGPTKKMVIGVLDNVRAKKKVKESRIITTFCDVILKRCRMVLRTIASEEKNRHFFSLEKPNESDESEQFAIVSRPLDFRTIDLRLDAGYYSHSLESFIEDVNEVWQNLRIKYRNKPKYLDSIETISKQLVEIYNQEVLTLVTKSFTISDTNELNEIICETTSSALIIAPWEDRICKICGIDENDHVLLLCDRCDEEYHTYCLDPPLLRIPKAHWYCPPCHSFILSQSTLPKDDCAPVVVNRVPEKTKIKRRIGFEALADLVDSLEVKEYWELRVEERVLLLQFLCDESLNSTIIRDHINADNSNIYKNFMGQDSAQRLYWILGQPEKLFVLSPHSEGELGETSENSSSRDINKSQNSLWICYESDADVAALINWLDDDYDKEKKLKKSIIKWQKNKPNDLNYHEGQTSVQVDCSKSTVYFTNARAELESIFGSVLEGEKIPLMKDNGKGKMVNEGKIYRCQCMELVGPTRHHCFDCHSTFLGNEVHQCELRKELTLTQDVESNGFLNPLIGKTFEIFKSLKIILLDIETALPSEAFRLSRGDSERLRAWRAFVKSARSIYEMVQATIILEEMIKTEHLKKEWWYWSSPANAANISTISSLALRIYALDFAIIYEIAPPPPVNLTAPSGSKSSSKKKVKLSSAK